MYKKVEEMNVSPHFDKRLGNFVGVDSKERQCGTVKC